MVGYKGPGITAGPGFRQKASESGKEIFTVLVVPEYLAPLNPTDNDMMQCPRGV